MLKKWTLLLVTLVISTQIKAETVKDALNEYDSSSQFLALIDETPLPEFQARTRVKLHKLLDQDINTITTPAQIEAINAAIDSVVNTMSSRIKDEEEFNELAEATKTEVQEVINEKIREAELQRLAQEAELQRLAAEEAAKLQSLANAQVASPLPPAASAEEVAAFAAPLVTTPNLVNAEPSDSQLADLAQELSVLDESSETDPVDALFLRHSDLFEDFMMSHNMSPLSDQAYEDALRAYLEENNVFASEYGQSLPEVARKLQAMQQATSFDTEAEEDDEDDDMDELLAGLNDDQLAEQNEYANGLVGTTSTRDHTPADAQAILDRAQAAIRNSQTRTMATEPAPSTKKVPFSHNLKILNGLIGNDEYDFEDNVKRFVTAYQQEFEKLVNQCKSRHNTKVVTREQLETELFNKFGRVPTLSPDDYANAVPYIADELVILQATMKRNKTVSPAKKAYKKQLKEKAKARKQQKQKIHDTAVSLLSQGANAFIDHYRPELETLIYQAWVQNNQQFLGERECGNLLVSFLNSLDLTAQEYRSVLPELREKLTLMEDALWISRQAELAPLAEEVLAGSLAQLRAEEAEKLKDSYQQQPRFYKSTTTNGGSIISRFPINQPNSSRTGLSVVLDTPTVNPSVVLDTPTVNRMEEVD